MVAILFRSKLSDDTKGYEAMSEEMLRLAQTMPGFVEFKSFRAEDGERLSVAWWQDEETLRIWRENVRHKAAQREGRERWYEYYKIDVAHIVRSKHFQRREKPANQIASEGNE